MQAEARGRRRGECSRSCPVSRQRLGAWRSSARTLRSLRRRGGGGAPLDASPRTNHSLGGSDRRDARGVEGQRALARSCSACGVRRSGDFLTGISVSLLRRRRADRSHGRLPQSSGRLLKSSPRRCPTDHNPARRPRPPPDGSREARRMRRAGRVPGILYGGERRAAELRGRRARAAPGAGPGRGGAGFERRRRRRPRRSCSRRPSATRCAARRCTSTCCGCAWTSRSRRWSRWS